MTDLIKDLRAPYWDDGSQHKLMAKAADEIERNRAAIAELVGALKAAYEHHMTTSMPQAIERFGSIAEYRQFGQDTWFKTVPDAITKHTKGANASGIGDTAPDN